MSKIQKPLVDPDDLGVDAQPKPPVTVRDREVVDVERLGELCAGIAHYVKCKRGAPVEWLVEVGEVSARVMRRQERDIHSGVDGR